MTKISYFGLALSTSLAAALNFGLLFWFLRKRLGGVGGREILGSVLRITAAALFMAGVCGGVYVWLHSLLADAHIAEKLRQLVEVFSSIGAGIAAFLIACTVIGVKENALLTQMVVSKLKLKRFAKAEVESLQE
jgi:putative peptidoglycan lipid II flippase